MPWLTRARFLLYRDAGTFVLGAFAFVVEVVSQTEPRQPIIYASLGLMGLGAFLRAKNGNGER